VDESPQAWAIASTIAPLSGWADSTVGWVSDSVTHAGIGFRSSTATYGVLRLIATAYLSQGMQAELSL